MIIAKTISFDAAHWLPNYNGKCKNLHGHHWKVELAVGGEVDESTGMVMDFSKLKAFLEEVYNRFDHGSINALINNPTAENICEYIRDLWFKKGEPDEVVFKWVKVWETEDSYALLS